MEPDAAQALAKAVAEDWNFRSHAIVDQQLTGIKPGDSEITGWQEDDNRVEATITTSTPQLLVLDRLCYPGWQAQWDGSPTDTVLVNGWQMGVVAPAGEHRLVLEFSYRSWGWSFILAGIGLAGLVGLLIWGLIRCKKTLNQHG